MAFFSGNFLTKSDKKLLESFLVTFCQNLTKSCWKNKSISMRRGKGYCLKRPNRLKGLTLRRADITLRHLSHWSLWKISLSNFQSDERTKSFVYMNREWIHFILFSASWFLTWNVTRWPDLGRFLHFTLSTFHGFM